MPPERVTGQRVVLVCTIQAGNDGNWTSIYQATGKRIIISREWTRLGGRPLAAGQMVIAHCQERERCWVAFPIISAEMKEMEECLNRLKSALDEQARLQAEEYTTFELYRGQECERSLQQRGELDALANQHKAEYCWDKQKLENAKRELDCQQAELTEHYLTAKREELIAGFAKLEEARMELLDAAQVIQTRVNATGRDKVFLTKVIPQSLHFSVATITTSQRSVGT